MNQANLLKRLIDYVRLEIETGAIKRSSPVGIAYRDYVENKRRPRAIDLVDFYVGWHAAITHFLDIGMIQGDPEELHSQYLDFPADKFYPCYVLPGGWLRRAIHSIRWFERRWFFDLPKRQEYLVVSVSTRRWAIGINLVSNPTLSLLCLEISLDNVPF